MKFSFKNYGVNGKLGIKIKWCLSGITAHEGVKLTLRHKFPNAIMHKRKKLRYRNINRLRDKIWYNYWEKIWYWWNTNHFSNRTNRHYFMFKNYNSLKVLCFCGNKKMLRYCKVVLFRFNGMKSMHKSWV